MMEEIPELYKRFYTDKNEENTGLFRLLKEEYKIETGLYPGSFVHITPSFAIANMTYIDSGFELVSTIERSGGDFSLRSGELAQHFKKHNAFAHHR